MTALLAVPLNVVAVTVVAVIPPDTHRDCAVTPARVETPVTCSVVAVSDAVNIRGAVTPNDAVTMP